MDMLKELESQKKSLEESFSQVTQERNRLNELLTQSNAKLIEMQGQHKLVVELIEKIKTEPKKEEVKPE